MPSPWTSPSATVPGAAGTFSPLRPRLRLDSHAYSPSVLRLIAGAAGEFPSFALASAAVGLSGVRVTPRHVGRIAAEVGGELAAAQAEKAVRRRRRELTPRSAAPPVAVVEVDGGRLRTRAAGRGPGVHDPQCKEEKVACLVNLDTPVHEKDPHPDLPASLLNPRRVQRLVRQMKGAAAPPSADEDEGGAEEGPSDGRRPPPPEDRVRTCVASTCPSRRFGPLVAAEAAERDFYKAARRAFVGDGAKYNWSIQQGYFPDFEPITDFLHVVCYLYVAAMAAGGADGERWARYAGWAARCWQGRVDDVVGDLRVAQARLGDPPEGAGDDDPRRSLAEAVTYLTNNGPRMKYPEYRRAGLPVTSSLVESLVGEFNSRVKGRGKFWNRPSGADPILQLRAAHLSTDGRLSRHFEARPGNPFRRPGTAKNRRVGRASRRTK